MPQSARILTTACPKPEVPLVDCQREYGSHSFRPSTKIQICRAVVVPILLIRRRDVGSLSEADQATGAVLPTKLALHPWHQRARPRVERRSPQDSQPAQHRVHLASGAAALGWPLGWLRWAGHVSRMEDVRMPKAVFFSELQEEKRDRGAPRKRYKDQLKRHLAQAGISHHLWQQEASDRDSWRLSVRKTSCEFEAEKHTAAKEKRTKAERACSIPTILIPNLRLSKMQ